MKSSTGIGPWLAAFLTASRRAAWFPALVFACHIIASRFVQAYRTLPALDIPMHFVGGLAIAYFLHAAIDTIARRRLIRAPDRVSGAVLLFALVSTLSVFWEFAEYAAAYTRGTHGRMSLHDTLLDMLVGIVGGTCFIAVKWLRD